MKKIIVPTDFSKGAENALAHAVVLSKKFDCVIELVHAFSLPAANSTVMVDITEIMEKNAKEELGAYLANDSVQNILSGVNFEATTRHGSVVDVLERICEGKGADLVVMGTHGASGFSEKWLGSNAAAASKSISTPLLVIPANKTYKEIENVLFATDMKVMDNISPLKTLSVLVENYGCSVTFAHVKKNDKDVDHSAYKAQVQELLGSDKPIFKIIEDDDVEDGIAKAIEDENPDLLVAVRHNYGFFEGLFHSSVSQHIVNSASIPVLIVTG